MLAGVRTGAENTTLAESPSASWKVMVRPSPARVAGRDLELERQRYSLELSRRRIQSELAATQSSLRRASLEQALKYLEGELAKLGQA